MSLQFYSDRNYGPAARTHEALPDATADGLKSLVRRRIDSNWLAKEFPSWCSDGDGITGTHDYEIAADVAALVPGITWPLWQEAVTDDSLFDLLEYVGQRIAKPSDGPYHPFFRHHELNFDERAGKAEFRDAVNQMLSRGGAVFEMTPQMQIHRIGSPEVQAAFRDLRPNTGDPTLDDMLETARSLYLSRRVADRVTAIEKLWDAFGRLKSLDVPGEKNTKKSIAALLDNISNADFRAVIESEMLALTSLGNQFQIRHHEVGQTPIPANAQDYVAARMVNLLVLLLEQSGRIQGP